MKKILKRVLSAALVVVMSMTLVGPVGAARVDSEAQAQATVIIGDAEIANATEKVQIPVAVKFNDETTSVSNIGLVLEYDKSMLSLESISTKKSAREYAIMYGGATNVDAGTVTWATTNEDEFASKATTAEDGFFGTDILFWITFKAKESYLNGTYNVSCDLIDDAEGNFYCVVGEKVVDFNVEIGEITLTGGLDKDDLKPTIATQPASASYVYDAEIAALSVEATVPGICEGLTYQWYKDGTVIEGATQATYQPEQIYGTTSYYCVVSTTYNDQPFTTASKTAEITYDQAALPADKFHVTPDSFVFDGTEKSPEYGVTGLKANVDWEVDRSCFSSAINAGTYTIKVHGIGNYKGSAEKTWTIERAPIAVPVAADGLTYNGQTQTGVPAGEGYTITGNTQKDAGSYTAVAVLDSNHKWADGTTANKNIRWTIAPKSVAVEWSNTELTYNGEKQVPIATVKTGIAGETLEPVVNGGQTNKGEYTATAMNSNDNYTLTNTSTDYSIGAKSVDVVWSDTTLTYNGKEQVPTAKVNTGIAGETLTPAVTGAKKDAGSYTATAAIDNANYNLGNTTTGFVIEANTQITDITAKEQNVVIEVGNFTEPKFTGIDGEAVTGTTTYTYKGATKTAAQINDDLQTLTVDAEVEIGYSFEATGNYSGTKTGTIKVKMVSIIYEVGGAAATINNAVTVKTDATYGDSWTDIVKINAIAASVNGTPVAGRYKLDVTGKPNAGKNILFKVFFTADSDERYQNVEVVSGTVDVAAKPVAVTWTNTALTYNGKEQTPTATAKGIDGKIIEITVDGGITNAGSGTAVAVTEDTNYDLTSAEKAFTVEPKSVAVTWGSTSLLYTGKEQAPEATAEGVDGYDVPIEITGKKTDVGSGTASARSTDSNYKLTGASKRFTITARPLNLEELTIEPVADQTYAAVALKPEVTIEHKVTGEVLDASDVTMAYSNNTNVGTASVTVAGKGNYSGKLTNATSFTILPKEVAVEWAEDELVYNGKEQAPAASAKGINGVNVPVSVTGGRKDVGAGTAEAKTINTNYKLTGETKDFAIQALELKAADLTISAIAGQPYTGAAVEPVVTIKHKTTGEQLDADDMTVSYADNTNVGIAKVGVTGKGNYAGIVAEATTFAIVPAQMTGKVTITADSLSYIKDTVLTANVDVNADAYTYQWLKDDAVIEGAVAQTYTIPDGIAGSIIKVRVTATGNYTGSITSEQGIEVGKIVLTGTVTITGEAALDAELTVNVAGADEATYDIVWLANGTAIQNANGEAYKVAKADQGKTITAKIVGKGDYTGEVVSNGIAIPAGRPDAVVLTARGSSRRVTLNWTAPANNGAAITGYQVKMDGEGQEWIEVAADQTSYVFEGLENGTEYTFYMKAINAVGESDEATVTAKPRAAAVSGGGGFTPKPEEPKPEEPKDTVTTKTDAAGNKVTTTEKVDGSVEVKAELNDKAVTDAVTSGTAVELPIDPVTVGDKATEVTINTGAKDKVEVEIPVAETTSGTVAVLVKADGTEQIIRDSVVTENGVVANVSDGDKIVIKDNSKEFKDVADHWGEDAVNFVAARGIFAGTGDGSTFSPNVATTRGMIAQVLHNLEYNKNHPHDGHSFPDVGDHHWYDDAVHWAEDHGIVGGYGDGTFKGDKEVTREELVVMLWNYAGKQAAKNNSLVNGFNDAANVSDWAKAAMDWALENGVLGGKGGKMLDPTGFATRAELAQMMKNYLENI